MDAASGDDVPGAPGGVALRHHPAVARRGHTLTSYASGKGLEFIPARNIQFIVGMPAWQTLDTSHRKDGWADQTFLMK